MVEPTNHRSWWQTIPGMLTALAAILTALTGLIVALNQAGILGTVNRSPDERPVVEDSARRGAPDRPTRTNTRGEVPTPWSDSAAVLHTREGSTVTIGAHTLSHIISVQQALDLKDGQSVPFEKMRRFDVMRVDDPGAPNAWARVKITLMSGDEVSGDVCAAHGCELFGYNDRGRYEIALQKLKAVEFRR